MNRFLTLKINYKIILICVYVLILLTLYRLQLIPKDLQNLKNIILSNPNSTILTFMLLSILRIFLFVPGAVFCVLGGLIFSPLMAILLSFTAYLASFTLIFVIGRYVFTDKLTKWILKNNPSLHQLLKHYGTKLFIVGLLCPIAPGDLLCLLLSTLDISFFKYILITGLTHLPWVILYGLLGYSFHISAFNLILLVVTILLITLYSIKSWNRLKS